MKDNIHVKILKRNNLKVGDEVLICNNFLIRYIRNSKHKKEKILWEDVWTKEMDEYIGKKYIISKIHSYTYIDRIAIRLKNKLHDENDDITHFNFPSFCLKKINKIK